MTVEKIPRVALFADSYLEVDGAARTCRKLTGFAKERGYPFLCVYADKKNETWTDGSVTYLTLKRSPLAIPMDEVLKYDPFFARHLKLVGKALDEFKPDLFHITGINDVSINASILAHQRQIPMLGSWHTNLHQFASRRLNKIFRFLPEKWRNSISGLAERQIYKGLVLYYKMPKIILAPNQELVESVGKGSGRDAFLMGRGVDSELFSPEKRTVNDGILRLGFAGRLRAEKNVRLLADLEKRLLEMGKTNFKFLIVGEGNEREYLEKTMKTSEFTGFISGETLAEAFAKMDIFVFPSETETFGQVTQEAMSSGVPAIVSPLGGSKFVVKDGETGFVAENFEDYVKFTVELMDNPEKLAKMKQAARDFVISNSWDTIFEGVYEAYQKTLDVAEKVKRRKEAEQSKKAKVKSKKLGQKAKTEDLRQN
jgi:glycosyltransferase involved in cell wall biosynthesis